MCFLVRGGGAAAGGLGPDRQQVEGRGARDPDRRDELEAGVVLRQQMHARALEARHG